MVLTFYFVFSWLMIGLFIFNRKKSWGTKMEATFLVFFSCLINTHTYLGLFETFKWMKTTIDPKLYIAFLLFRSVFIPFFISYSTLIIMNYSLLKKLGFLLIYSLLIFVLDKFNLNYELYRFKNWNHLMTLGYYYLYLISMILALMWFRSLGGKEGNGDDVDRKGIWPE